MDKKFKDFDKRVLKISEETGVILPQKDYLYGIISCYNCSKEILIFTWLDLENNDEEISFAIYSQDIPDGKNKPKTIKYIESRTIESSYWANSCPYCDALQGDFFLHNEPDSPFFVGATSKEEDLKDIQKRIIKYNIDLLSI
jgi:thiol-disulfide isomerase/thioredoxin